MHVGCKTFEQPVLMKSLVNKFGAKIKSVRIPVAQGTVFQAGEVQDKLKGKKKYRTRQLVNCYIWQGGRGRILTTL